MCKGSALLRARGGLKRIHLLDPVIVYVNRRKVRERARLASRTACKYETLTNVPLLLWNGATN